MAEQNEERLHSQEQMEEIMRRIVEENYTLQGDRINGLIKPRLIACSYEERSSVMEYPIQEWQGNRYHIMQGGMVTTCIDNAMAILSLCLATPGHSTTLSIEVNFLRPIATGGTLVVTTKAAVDGRKVIHFQAEASDKETGKVIANATAVYMKLEKPQGERQ